MPNLFLLHQRDGVIRGGDCEQTVEQPFGVAFARDLFELASREIVLGDAEELIAVGRHFGHQRCLFLRQATDLVNDLLHLTQFLSADLDRIHGLALHTEPGFRATVRTVIEEFTPDRIGTNYIICILSRDFGWVESHIKVEPQRTSKKRWRTSNR